MQAPVKSEWKPIRASVSSLRMTNPIRALLETIKVPENPEKEMIDLSIGTINEFSASNPKSRISHDLIATGDPTVYDNLSVHPFVKEELKKVVDSPLRSFHGYVHSAGSSGTLPPSEIKTGPDSVYLQAPPRRGQASGGTEVHQPRVASTRDRHYPD